MAKNSKAVDMLEALREELSELHSELRAETQRLNIRINEVERRIEAACTAAGEPYRRTRISLMG